MKNIFLFFIIFCTGFLSAQTLTVQVENITNGQGYLMIGVFNDEENFPDNYFRGDRVRVSDTVMRVTFSDLPAGQYVVSVFQDSNSNGKLDTNIFGIPREKYGFSNDIRRPNYSQSTFNFNEDMTIIIPIK